MGLGTRKRIGSNARMPRSKEVDAWFAKYENPMKEVVQKVREIVLAADTRIDECIKWQAPTFTFEGNLASFFPKSKKHASLMFHQGAKIPGRHPLLEGSGAVSRMVKLGSVKEASAAKAQLIAIVKAWCDWRSGEAKNDRKTKKPFKTKAANKKTATRIGASSKRTTRTKAVKELSSTKRTRAAKKIQAPRAKKPKTKTDGNRAPRQRSPKKRSK